LGPVASPTYPATGLVLLGLSDGVFRGAATVGSDPVAVLVSDDGATAFVADSSPGDVYAVHLPELGVVWRAHVGGAPFGLLMNGDRLLVSLFDSATVVELDPQTGAQVASHHVSDEPAVLARDAGGRVVVACRSGHLDVLNGQSVPAGAGFGVAAVGRSLWTADYEHSDIVPAGGGASVALPLRVFPFWLAPGAQGTLLVSAEGAAEDTDPGGVFSYDPMTSTFRTLARPRDPDQVLRSGPDVYVAAHGDRNVLAIGDAGTAIWASGASAVGLSADPPLKLLVVVVNANE